MPSDARVAQALACLDAPIAAFRATLVNTSEQVRLLISTRLEHNGASVQGARAELGPFAAGRIDAERMARLLTQVEPPAIEHGEAVVRALATCNELLARREQLFHASVAEGGDLRAAVAGALAGIGRAFGAARVADLVSQGGYREAEHAGLLDAHPFEHWSRAERSVPLGLVVSVAGRDLRVGGLADFVDRSLKLVLVVEGDAPPAALVRLITPGVAVLQASDVEELDWIAKLEGPAVAALIDGSAAHFRHDPEGGARLAERLVITQGPDHAPTRRGVSSAFQQQQELEQLEALAAGSPEPVAMPSAGAARAVPPGSAPVPPSPAPAPPSSVAAPPPEQAVAEARPGPGADDVDKLAAWLLQQADLPGPG